MEKGGVEKTERLREVQGGHEYLGKSKRKSRLSYSLTVLKL